MKVIIWTACAVLGHQGLAKPTPSLVPSSYWAAALADDKFRQLCGSYAAVLEQLNLSIPVKYDLSGKLRKTDISAGKPEAHISLGFSRFFPHTFGLQRKLESLRNRLARDLDKRFRILIEGKSDQDRHVANQKAEAILSWS